MVPTADPYRILQGCLIGQRVNRDWLRSRDAANMKNLAVAERQGGMLMALHEHVF